MLVVERLPEEEIELRHELGAISRFPEFGLKFMSVDCGDERGLVPKHVTGRINSFNQAYGKGDGLSLITDAEYGALLCEPQKVEGKNKQGSITLEELESGLTVVKGRVEQVRFFDPARLYGGASALGLIALAAMARKENLAMLQHIGKIHTAEGFVDFSAHVAVSALDLEQKVFAYQHSADGNEEADDGVADHKCCSNPLGCAFAHNIGYLLHSALQPENIRDSYKIAEIAGKKMRFEEALERMINLAGIIPDDLSVHRKALNHALTRGGFSTMPIAMHEGPHFPSQETAVVFDFAGYKSNANRSIAMGLPRYHQGVQVARILLPQILPEFGFDQDETDLEVMDAMTVLLGTPTRRALSGADTPYALRVEVLAD